MLADPLEVGADMDVMECVVVVEGRYELKRKECMRVGLLSSSLTSELESNGQ